MRKTKTNIRRENLELSAEILRALAHPLRMKILSFIDKSGTINVNKIYNTLKLEQSITSQHLRILRNAGLVIAKREGKFMIYSIAYGKVDQAVNAIKEFEES